MSRRRTDPLAGARADQRRTTRRRSDVDAARLLDSIELVLESITDKFFALDSEWRYTQFNSHAKAQLKALGKDPATLIGKVLWDVFPNAGSEAALRRAMRDRVTMVHTLFYVPLREWYENRIYPTRDGGLAVFQADITERKHGEQLRQELVGRLFAAQEEERARISRELHDDFGQKVTALRLKLAALHSEHDGSGALGAHLSSLDAIVKQLDGDIDLITWRLRPAALDDLGLDAAIANYVGSWSQISGVPVEVHVGDGAATRLTEEIETALYRIMQEALNNVAKHARASHASVVLQRTADHVTLIVEDTGAGFETEHAFAARDKRLGLAGMRERATLLTGTLAVESRPGEGTTVIARIPARLR
jgi:signal transduction histidine kinase